MRLGSPTSRYKLRYTLFHIYFLLQAANFDFSLRLFCLDLCPLHMLRLTLTLHPVNITAAGQFRYLYLPLSQLTFVVEGRHVKHVKHDL